MAEATYKALKRLKVGDGFRYPGDEVPEAKDWPNVWAYLRNGELEKVNVRDPEPQQEQQEVLTVTQPPADDRGGLGGLRAEAERLGIKVDGRWNESRLHAEIEKAKRGAVDGR